LGAFLLTFILASHDLMTLLNSGDDIGIRLSRFAAPLLLTTFSAVFMWRFAVTMNMLDQFNSRLTREVAATEEALLLSFERERKQANAATLEAERVRLMSDLHDGIAGQLVSILSLCELREVGQAEVAGTVRAALADLRLIVASLDDYGEDLAVMLALFRERIEPQVAAHGVELVWRVGSLPDLKGLHPGAALAIFRILQEAANNALRHSGSAELRFEAGRSPMAGEGVRLCVRDRGRGGADNRPGSYGMGNMRRRAEGLGAVLTIQSDADGTAVILDLPARLPPAAPSPSGMR
ncbi:sensor histidine kinase, partial [Azospirillum sp. B506]|uniref:sensor histidine kinase n=1 Tax=Azospirillum sp. B506 TaxID=137721 RepID=UPI0035D49AEF